jgi:hypothetical protein
VLDQTITKTAHSLGVSVPPGAVSDQTPPAALLAGYRAAQWCNFAFMMVGLVLAILFLRNIGVIAAKQPDPEDMHVKVMVIITREKSRETEDDLED